MMVHERALQSQHDCLQQVSLVCVQRLLELMQLRLVTLLQLLSELLVVLLILRFKLDCEVKQLHVALRV